jgi:hypothetical protein
LRVTEGSVRSLADFVDRLSRDTVLQNSTNLRTVVTTANLADLATRLQRMHVRLVAIRGEFERMQSAIERKDAEIKKLVDGMLFRVTYDLTLSATTVGDFATRAGWYISADLGLAWVPQFGDVHPYAGVNFYLTPVNKSVPMSQLPYRWEDYLARVCSPMLGITLKGVSEEGQRDNLVLGQGMIVGAGCRFGDALRVSGGWILFRAISTNRLSNNRELAGSAFLSSSIDADVKSLLGKIGELIF